MKLLKIESLLEKRILSVNRIVVTTSNSDEYEMDDSLVLRLPEGLVQILNIYNSIEALNAHKLSDLVIWSDFDRASVKIHLKLVREIENNKPVSYLYNYAHGSYYFFGTKCLDENMEFVTGFCYGFDEIKIQNEVEFEALLSKYPVNINVQVIHS